MSTLLKIWFTVLVLPTIVTVVVYLSDSILTFELSNQIWEILSSVDYVIWTRITNMIFIAISTILIVQIARRLFKFITWNLNNNED